MLVSRLRVLLAALLLAGSVSLSLTTAPAAAAPLDLCKLLRICLAPPPPAPQCSNARDDDGDGKVDGTDRGCYSGRDDNESDDNLRWGFNDTSFANYQIPRASFLQYLRASGAALNRFNISWQTAEPQRGSWNAEFWRMNDELYRQELDVGVRPVLTVLGTPYWALHETSKKSTGGAIGLVCDGYNKCHAPPDVRQPDIRAAWQAWIRKVVQHYPEAAAIEIWNEPNLKYFWFVNQDPALYALMLSSAKEAVREVDPSMPVVMGGVNGFRGPDRATDLSLKTFLRWVYATAGKNSFDAISYHDYPCPGQPVAGNMNYNLNILRAIKDENADWGKPLWLTETGVTNGLSGAPANCGGTYREKDSAQALKQALEYARYQNGQHGDLPVVLIHQLFNHESRLFLQTPNGSGQNEFGVIAYNWNPFNRRTTLYLKPAWTSAQCAFRTLC